MADTTATQELPSTTLKTYLMATTVATTAVPTTTLPADTVGVTAEDRVPTKARTRARQGYRIGLFESRIGSTGPGAINRVNCWFRPHPPYRALLKTDTAVGSAGS